MNIVEGLPVYGVHFYDVKVKSLSLCWSQVFSALSVAFVTFCAPEYTDVVTKLFVVGHCQ